MDPVSGRTADRFGRFDIAAGRLEAWAKTWWGRAGSGVLAGYLGGLRHREIVPDAPGDLVLLLDVLLVELSLDHVLAAIRCDEPADPGDLALLLDLADAGPQRLPEPPSDGP